MTRDSSGAISEIAAAAGVSVATVVSAFNSPGRLDANAERRIRAVASELGYRAHSLAASASDGWTGMLGVLVPQPLEHMLANPLRSEFLRGVAREREHLTLPVRLALGGTTRPRWLDEIDPRILGWSLET